MGKCRELMWLVCVGLLLSMGAAAAQAGLQDGLASYFKLDEPNGTMAADSSGHGNDGTLYGQGVAWAPGHFGGGLYLATDVDEAGMQFPTAGMSAPRGRSPCGRT